MKPIARSARCSGALLSAADAGAPSNPVPATLVPEGEPEAERIASRGVSAYKCRAKAGDPSNAAWFYAAAEADLLDSEGRKIGRHTFRLPVWESSDGSRVAAEIKASADSSVPGAVPWLLVATRSIGTVGRLAKATSFQRVDTAGGTAPAIGWDAKSIGARQRVSFPADYGLLSR